jgi:hypothetical protein
MANVSRFTVIKHEYLVLPDQCDSELIDTVSYDTDLTGALDATYDQSWDNIDEREDEVIFYPADSRTDITSGDITQEHLVIKSTPNRIRRMMSILNAQKGRN